MTPPKTSISSVRSLKAESLEDWVQRQLDLLGTAGGPFGSCCPSPVLEGTWRPRLCRSGGRLPGGVGGGGGRGGAGQGRGRRRSMPPTEWKDL